MRGEQKLVQNAGNVESEKGIAAPQMGLLSPRRNVDVTTQDTAVPKEYYHQILYVFHTATRAMRWKLHAYDKVFPARDS